MSDFDELMKEFNVKYSKDYENADYHEETVIPEAGKNFTDYTYKESPQSSYGSDFENMQGAFKGKKEVQPVATPSAKRRSSFQWPAWRGRVSQVPITFIICTILSIIMAVYIILNFEEVTWVIVYGIYQILSVGMIVFLLIVVLLGLILALRRRRGPRDRWWW